MSQSAVSSQEYPQLRTWPLHSERPDRPETILAANRELGRK